MRPDARAAYSHAAMAPEVNTGLRSVLLLRLSERWKWLE